MVLGARPNFIKAAAFFHRARQYPTLSFTIVHTGQHFDHGMSDVFFKEMQIPHPHFNLGVQGGTYAERISRMIEGIRNIAENRKYSGIIVFGDVDSTLAAALASVGHAPLIHIEAGLRSYDRRMPEEMNRFVIDHLSEVLFTTEPSANRNLASEGIPKAKIHYVGNLMIESLELFSTFIEHTPALEEFGLEPREYTLATIHRAENIENTEIFKKILIFLGKLARTRQIIMPLHPNTLKKIEKAKLKRFLKDIVVTEPLGYLPFMKLLANSAGIVTDSGGIQEETSHLGIPCLTLRDNTERPITIDIGSNKLFNIDQMTIAEAEKHLMRTDFRHRHIPLWDRSVSKRIMDCLNDL